MNTDICKKSPTDACDSILNHIINCANCAIQNEDAFQKAMLGLAGELRSVFESEFCSIGIVSDGFAEDCVISYKKFEEEELSKQQEIFLKSVKRASLDDDSFVVCLALKSDEDIFFLHNNNQFNDCEYYQTILTSGHLKNSFVIPIRDKKNNKFGFIQFINSKNNIDYERYIQPYKNALLGLVQLIINSRKHQQELVFRVKEADFYNKMQDKRHNANDLLDSIMKYFSKEFNAAIVSFRIPLLNGDNSDPLFYLRRVFIHPSLEKHEEIKRHYLTDRLIRSKTEMNAIDNLRCDDQDKILNGKSNSRFTQFNLDLNENTLIMPIFRDMDQKCNHPLRKGDTYCKNGKQCECIYRFKRFYGFFRLRISKKDLSNPNKLFNFDYEDTLKRLDYLSKQITLLINSIINKNENDSLQIFQNELKNNSFIRIKDFDESCVEIIKQSVHAKVCSIYRYDERTKLLSLSATTASIIQFNASGEKLYLHTQQIKKSCFIHIKARNNFLARAYHERQSQYVFNILDPKIHQSPFIESVKSLDNCESAMVVPMLKKDGTFVGTVLLLGKDELYHPLSTSYWEHDIKPIEFIVNILTRISESDNERLTFFSQLSHELLAPVTELAYDNELTANIAERNPENFSRQHLISKLRENVDRYMIFKYIINDTEFIYSSTSAGIGYNIVKQEKPQETLLNAIRLMENKAHVKGLSIKTNISKMPPLYFDKERMMQVFLNLIHNAIKYSDNYTTIEIFYKKGRNNFHEIHFSNVGIGIQEDEKETIFELFHRTKEAKKKIIRGTGMGLFIVRNIMRAHEGDCYVYRLENPTEFVITLPNINS